MLANYKNFIKNSLYNNKRLWRIVETVQGLNYAWKYNYYYQWGLQKNTASSLEEINIEFSSECNLRCKFCSLDHLKPKTYIEESTLEHFLKNLITDRRFQNVKRIQLFNAGETLLHPKKIELLALIKTYKEQAIQKGLKFPEVHILTNGMLLRERVSKAIIDLDIIDVMRMSLDGGTPEAFETMRERAKWNVFYQNFKDFVTYNTLKNANIKVWTTSIIPENQSFDLGWMHPEFSELLLLADSYELRRLHSWAGEIDGVTTKNKSYKIGCTLAMNQMVLLPNGDVTVCCSDLNSRGVIGNLLQTNLYEIYASKERRRYLDLLYKNQKNALDLCKDCETF